MRARVYVRKLPRKPQRGRRRRCIRCTRSSLYPRLAQLWLASLVLIPANLLVCSLQAAASTSIRSALTPSPIRSCITRCGPKSRTSCGLVPLCMRQREGHHPPNAEASDVGPKQLRTWPENAKPWPWQHHAKQTCTARLLKLRRAEGRATRNPDGTTMYKGRSMVCSYQPTSCSYEAQKPECCTCAQKISFVSSSSHRTPSRDDVQHGGTRQSCL